ncbi:MAG: thiol-disulfide oxidoreductase DCC family protein [Gammaproteobacteria bacterium]
MNQPTVVLVHPRIILFDGVCNLCSAWVQFVCRRDPKSTFKFVSVQSETGKTLLAWCGLPTEQYDTMVYIEHGTGYIRSAAFLRIVQHLPFPWPLLAIGSLIPRGIRNWLYDRIALNRYRLFGKTVVCFTPSDELSKRFL